MGGKRWNLTKKEVMMLSRQVTYSKNKEVAKIVNGVVVERFMTIWDYLEFLCEGNLRRLNPFTWKCCIGYADRLSTHAELYDLGFSNEEGEEFCVALAHSIKEFALLVDGIVRKSRMDERNHVRAQKINQGRNNFIENEKLMNEKMELIDAYCILEGKKNKLFSKIRVNEMEICV